MGRTALKRVSGRTGHVSVSGNVAIRPETRFTAVPNVFPCFVPVSVRKRTSMPRFLQHSFWANAVNTAVYLKDRSPTRSLEFKTPFEDLYGYKPAVKHLRIFGCKAFAHIPNEDKKKLDSKTIRCTFIGYCSSYKAYRLFNPSTHKIFVNRDVKFHEQDSEETDEHYVG